MARGGRPGTDRRLAAGARDLGGEGDRRSCTLAQGGDIEERILEHSDDERRYRYGILDGPLPVRSYVSTLSVDGHGGHSHVSWEAEFEPEDESQEAELRQTFEQMYGEGLEAAVAASERRGLSLWAAAR